jgi:hypothetical protein
VSDEFEALAAAVEYEKRRVLIREEVIRIGSRLSAALDAIDRNEIAEAAERLGDVESTSAIREVVAHLRVLSFDLGDPA